MRNEMRCGRFYTDVVASGTMNFPGGDMQKEKRKRQDAARSKAEGSTAAGSTAEGNVGKLRK